MTTPCGPRVLVVDDDAEVRAVLAEYLGRHGYAVTLTDNAAGAREVLVENAFDLAVIDVIMPGEDGLSLARFIRERLGIAIVMLTAVDTPIDRVVGMAVGADDYLTKPFHPRELVIRIEPLLGRAGRRAGDEEADSGTWFGPLRLDAELRGLRHRDGRVIHLGPAEYAVLDALAQRPRQTVDRRQLIGLAGPDAGSLSERGVDLQIHRLRRKIEPDPRRPTYLRTIAGCGYMLVPGAGADGD